MKRWILLVMIGLFQTAVFAQATRHWEWAKADTGINYTVNPGYPRQVVAANASGTVLWGELKQSKLAMSGVSYGDYQLYEYDSSGKKLAGVNLGGKVYLVDAQADTAGNWYIAGKVYDSIALPTGTIWQRMAASSPEYFIMRLDAGTLNLKWFEFIGTNYYNVIYSFYVKGNTIYLPVDSGLGNIIYKVNTADGAMTPFITQTGCGRVNNIIADSNDNVYVAGSCPGIGTANYGGHSVTITSPYLAFIIRYKNDGQYDWSEWMQDITCPYRKLTYGNDNAVYYTGEVNDSFTIGGLKVKKPLSIGSTFLAASLDSNGSVRWVKQPKDTAGSANLTYSFNAVAVDTTLVVMPSVRNYIDWEDGITTNFGNKYVIALAGYNTSGITRWVTHGEADISAPQHIVTNGKDIWITGNARDSFTLQFDTVSVFVAATGYTPFMAKLHMPPAYTAPIVVADKTKTTSFTVFPNPANNEVFISGLKDQVTEINLKNVTGVTVYKRLLQHPLHTERINCSSFAKGVYFIELKNSEGKEVKKLVLQ
jgi:hypothetical protein